MQLAFSKEFKRDLKKLKKPFRTLDSDLQNFIKVQIKLFHELKLDNQGIVEISGLGIEYPKIFKARKFACRSLKGTGSRSGIRIIYAYFLDQNKIEFIEIYYKGDKENEDQERIESKYG
ncbi:MAG: hypothetical protein K9N09_02975 [Candidatus Cloacimonetes bacterium]|nr:hypothetical protein [Candidatus Cloacimonadota bacterium]MCF7813191.1 hypothetical protein [Candidatus Cloacimonadota bacterium]MCF7867639.1 hypothetical protein [Candidatus Cloacimonadota bacterium]MCF7883086.1 hypothetical protein [Candidatus Cloacimonadota bacterium]